MASQSIGIAPIPVKDNLNLILSNNDIAIHSVTISDINGRRILEDHTNQKSRSVDHLKSGIYLVSISTDKETLTKKFLK